MYQAALGVSTTGAKTCRYERLLLMPHSGQEAEKHREGTALLPSYLILRYTPHLKVPTTFQNSTPSTGQGFNTSAYRDNYTKTVAPVRGYLNYGSCYDEYFEGQDLMEIPGSNFGCFSA